MSVRLQFRRGTEAEWFAADTILGEAEIGYETDTKKIKVGNGITSWNSLSYVNVVPSDLVNTLNDYVLVGDVGNAGGPAKLDSNGNLLIPKSSIILEGSLANDYETTITISNPTADRTITFKDESGTVALLSDIDALIDGAPGALNTLNELSAALGDDENYASTITTALGLITQGGIDHASSTTNVHGIGNTANLATKSYSDTTSEAAAATAVGVHNIATTNIHGIADTADLMLKSGTTMTGDLTLNGDPDYDMQAATKKYVDDHVDTHNASETNVHGIEDTADLATKTYADTSSSTAVGTHNSATESVHGIANTSLLVTTTGSQTLYNKTLSTPAINASTMNTQTLSTLIVMKNLGATASIVVESTSPIASASAGDTIVFSDITSLAPYTYVIGSTFSWESGTTISFANNQYQNGAQSPMFTWVSNGETNVTTTTVFSAQTPVTISSVEIGTLDGVTSNIQSQLNLKAPISSPTFTGTTTTDDLVINGDLTLNGDTFSASATSIVIEDNILQLAHENPANTVDLGIVVSYNDGAQKHAGLIKDATDSKWKLFKDVTTEPATTVDFTEGSLDDLKLAALEATTITPSSGVIFSDGTQTKEGVPSRTPIILKTEGYKLSALSERDSLIEIDSETPVTLIIPQNSDVAFPIGTTLDILQTGTGTVTIAGEVVSDIPVVTVNATPGLKLRTQWSSVTLFKRAENSWVVYGDLKE